MAKPAQPAPIARMHRGQLAQMLFCGADAYGIESGIRIEEVGYFPRTLHLFSQVEGPMVRQLGWLRLIHQRARNGDVSAVQPLIDLILELE